MPLLGTVDPDGLCVVDLHDEGGAGVAGREVGLHRVEARADAGAGGGLVSGGEGLAGVCEEGFRYCVVLEEKC